MDGGGRYQRQTVLTRNRHSIATSSNTQMVAPQAEASVENYSKPPVQLTAPNVYDIERICVGMHVKIERSNGRVQSALITALYPDKNGAAVEWQENGETKGKDVDLGMLMRNNPDVFKANVVNNEPSRTAKSLRHSIASPNPQRRTPATFRPLPQHPIVPHQDNGHDRTLSPEELQLKAHQQQAVLKGKKALVGGQNSGNKEKRRTHVVRKQGENSSRKVVLNKLPDVVHEPLFEIQNENEPIGAELSAQQPQRSQLLENIKELERNREQRRVQQGKARRQREIQQQTDPGNPNWEFLAMIRNYQSQLVYRPLSMSDEELAGKEVEVITVPYRDHVIVHQPQVKVDLTKYLVNHKFRFDYAFNETASNEMVYRFSAQPLVRTIFQRGFATCFAYGQTGSGKTHTMGGIIEGRHQDCSNGIYAMTAHDVFVLLRSPDYANQQLSVSCSFFEIYGVKVFDLLNKKAVLRILEDGRHLVQVVGLREVKVHSVDEVLKLIKIGSDQRTAGQTSANSNSSRSHAVFQIILRKWEKERDALYGKFSLIDLAGNERGADTITSDRQTRLEGAEINKSLLALKECIRAMGQDEGHIPFRGSKLTLILRDSFTGRNAKTCMIAMVSPGINSVENSMNTLRYADRVKELDGRDDQQPMENDDQRH
uniref:Kinesin-like protein n=1 Tax=Globodera rostochiensis TaxID=31243 RepID=A0A914HI95_GLORO